MTRIQGETTAYLARSGFVDGRIAAQVQEGMDNRVLLTLGGGLTVSLPADYAGTLVKDIRVALAEIRHKQAYGDKTPAQIDEELERELEQERAEGVKAAKQRPGLLLNVECTNGPSFESVYHPTTTHLLLNTLEESIETWDKDDVDALFSLSYTERDRRYQEEMNKEERYD